MPLNGKSPDETEGIVRWEFFIDLLMGNWNQLAMFDNTGGY